MKNNKKSREEIASYLAKTIAIFFMSIIALANVFFNLSSLVTPLNSIFVGLLTGFLFSYMRKFRNKKDKIKDKLAESYDIILDKSFLNPSNKIKKGAGENGPKK